MLLIAQKPSYPILAHPRQPHFCHVTFLPKVRTVRANYHSFSRRGPCIEPAISRWLVLMRNRATLGDKVFSQGGGKSAISPMRGSSGYTLSLPSSVMCIFVNGHLRCICSTYTLKILRGKYLIFQMFCLL